MRSGGPWTMKVDRGRNVRLVVSLWRFIVSCTPILLVDSLFSEFDSSNCQFDSAFEEVDSSLCEFVSSSCQFDSSAGPLTTSVRRPLSFCRFVVSTRPLREAIIRCTLHEELFDSMH